MKYYISLFSLCLSLLGATPTFTNPSSSITYGTNKIADLGGVVFTNGQFHGLSTKSSIANIVANRNYYKVVLRNGVSIQNTLDGITDASPERVYLLYLPNGIYTETFRLPSWVDIAGESKDGTIIQSSSTTADTIWWDGGYNLIRDLTVKSTHNSGDSGAKQYPIHGDAISTSGLEDASSELLLYNVAMHALGTDAKSGIGFGLYANQRAWLVNCECYSSYIYGLYAHNQPTQPARSELYVIDTFVHNLSGGGVGAFQWSNLDSGKDDYIVLENSRFYNATLNDITIWNDVGYGGQGEAWLSVDTNCVYSDIYMADTNKFVRNIPIRMPFSSIQHFPTLYVEGDISTGRYGVENGQLDIWGNTGGQYAGGELDFRMRVNSGNTNSIIAQIKPLAYAVNAQNRLDFKVGIYNNNQDAGLPLMSILDNGYTGLSITNPTCTLDVGGNAYIRTKLNIASTNQDSIVNIGNPYIAQGDISLWSGNFGAGEASKIEWRNHPSGGSDAYMAKISPYGYSPAGENRLDIMVGAWNRTTPITTRIASFLSNQRAGILETNPTSTLTVGGTFNTTGKAGIGTSTLHHTLNVAGGASITGNLVIGSTNALNTVDIESGHILVRNAANSTGVSGKILESSISDGSYTNYGVSLRMKVEDATLNKYGMQIYTQPHSGTGQVERVRIGGNGYVGINQAIPTERLDVNGNVNVDGTAQANTLLIKGSSSGLTMLKVPAAGANNTLTFPNNPGTSGDVMQTDGSGNLSWTSLTSSATNSGISSINGLTNATQTIVGGTGVTVTPSGSTHTIDVSMATLTRGTGLTGNNYTGTTPQTWAVDLGTGATQAAAGNHTHQALNIGTGLVGATPYTPGDGTSPTWSVDLGTAHTQAAYGDHTHSELGQGLLRPVSDTYTADHNVTSSESVIKASPGSATLTMTLPLATANTGRLYTFKRTAGTTTYPLVIAPSGTSNIDGGLQYQMSGINEAVTLISDGSNWLIISKYNE